MALDEQAVLLNQVRALQCELKSLEGWLDDAKIGQIMREPVRIGFSQTIKERRDDLDRLCQRLDAGKMTLAMAWHKFRESQRHCQWLLREYLAFIQGALARQAEVDHGLCSVADALLEELSTHCGLPWDRFTILAEGECFQEMVGIIRVRFPELTIWNLPVAAHEFGHYVAQELHVRQPGQPPSYPVLELINRISHGDPQLSQYLHEYFADLFATYALGPAYAYTCILQRFDPGAPDGQQHPGAAKRVYFILKTLDQMDKGKLLAPYLSVTTPLRKIWQQSLVAAQQPATLDQDITARLDDWFVQMYVILDKRLLDTAKYSGWTYATGLSHKFLVQPGAGYGDRLSDILNAAWLHRLNNWQQSDAISTKVMALVRKK